MQGLWTHMEDSLAIVEISDEQWIFKYGEESNDDDKFNITISDTLTAFVNKNVKADFVILSNSKDTLNYELTGLTDDILSLMYYPRGNTQVYRKNR